MVTGAAACVLATTTVGATAQRVVSMWHSPIVRLGPNQSSNWSGYNQGTLEQGGKLFTSVSGTWRVPKATPHKAGEAEYSSTWIGIGGGCVDQDCNVGDSTLIQAGTEQDVDASGKASYSAWWELIPAPSITIDGFAVHAGDLISASIKETPANSGLWTISVKNVTTGRPFTQTVPYSSTHATAEWIVETPVVIDDSGNVSIGPLPKLSQVRFDKATTNGAAPGLKASEEIQLVDPNTDAVLATPSAPDGQKNGFADCTYAKSCPTPR